PKRHTGREADNERNGQCPAIRGKSDGRDMAGMLRRRDAQAAPPRWKLGEIDRIRAVPYRRQPSAIGRKGQEANPLGSLLTALHATDLFARNRVEEPERLALRAGY